MSVDEITVKFEGMTVFTVVDFKKGYWGCIADNIIINGKDEQEHDKHYLNFMDTSMRNNLTLNTEKTQFKQSTVSFFAFYWSDDGIATYPKKIEAITHMKMPENEEFPGNDELYE